MKKYIDYKVGLCIGLLSLHTLSGCVSTRKELGWRPRLDTIWGSMSRWSDRNPKKAIAAKALAGVYTIGTIAGVCYGVSHFWGSSKTSLGYINNNNGSMPFNTTASPDGNTITFPYTNLTTTEIAQMTQGIEDGKEKWGTNETFTDDTTITTNSADTVDDSSTTESTTSTTIEDTSIPTTTSTTTSEDSSTIESTTSISSTKLTTDDGIPPIENPMVLDDRVLEDLKSSNFSEESIKNWLAKGLDKNAKTENGDTLLFEAAYQPSEDAVKYLLYQVLI